MLAILDFTTCLVPSLLSSPRRHLNSTQDPIIIYFISVVEREGGVGGGLAQAFPPPGRHLGIPHRGRPSMIESVGSSPLCSVFLFLFFSFSHLYMIIFSFLSFFLEIYSSFLLILFSFCSFLSLFYSMMRCPYILFYFDLFIFCFLLIFWF